MLTALRHGFESPHGYETAGQEGAAGVGYNSVVVHDVAPTGYVSRMYTLKQRECTLSAMEVGIRQLRNHLSDYLERVREGDEVIVTDRGSAVARIVPVAGGRALDRLVAEGIVTLAAKSSRPRPTHRVRARGEISDLVGEQRR